MNRGDHYGPSGGGDYDNGGDNGRRKRSFDQQDDYNSYDNGGYKRSRYDGRGGNYRPRNDRYGGSGGGGRGRYGGNDRGSYGRQDRYGGAAPSESERARAWRLAKKSLVELGDDVTDQDATALREHLQDAATRLAAEIEGDGMQHAEAQALQTLLLQCVSRLAHKTSLYAVLTALLTERSKAFGEQLLHAAVAFVQKDVDFLHRDRDAPEHDHNAAAATAGMVDEDALRRQRALGAVALRIKLVVRFLGELVSVRVVRAEDVLSVLDSLQGVCTPDDFTVETDEPLRTREHAAAFKDFFASVVLDTLLYCGQSLMVSCEDMYESLLSRCKEYVLNREEESNPTGSEVDHATNWLIRRMRLELLWEPENEEELAAVCKKVDPLALKWEAVNVIRSQPLPTDVNNPRWQIPGTIYPQALFADAFRSAEPLTLSTSLSIDVSTLDHTKVLPYPSVFRILGEDTGAAGAAIANLPSPSYVVVRDFLTDMIEAFHPRPAMGAKQLLTLCRVINSRFARDQEAANAPGAAAKTEYILVESLLATMLAESDKQRSAYYSSLLYHLVKTDARSISPALAIVVELLFREIPVMNAGAVDAFVQLFSHFLSNFEFKWPWTHWSHVLEAQEDDAQRLFVSAVIERCVRLSYLQFMESVLPKEFHMLLPPVPSPSIKYKAESTGDAATDVSPAVREFYNAALSKLKTHPPPASALLTWTEAQMQTSGLAAAEALEALWSAVLEAGAATFTHILLLTEKYRELFTDSSVFSGEANQLVLVKTVGSVWLKSPQHIGLILNMMLRVAIIDATTIAKWVFTPDAIQQYSWPYVWCIINETIMYTQDVKKIKQQALKKAAGDSSVDVSALEDSLKGWQDELKQVLIVLFEGFNRVISEHKSNCDSEGVSFKDNWFGSALAQMRALGRNFRVALADVIDELHVSVFNSNAADHDAKKVFHVLRDSYRSR
ncbi:TPA: hypothetical protein N0F65_008773 [Lagenidium giganteum]|uniref:Nuclear cap-binding protein subunit 1 n=1 Tax=Lagenidium giganteum TaxID=4803 RepID=A0AAV2Z3B2_9STRA|nr:TPA: hypothetical protein N0F65_008773 [Lagenidium giganteum]